MKIVLSSRDSDRSNAADVIRAAIVIGANRILRAAFVMHAVEMIERRDGNDHSIAHRMQPAEIREIVAFVFDIMKDGTRCCIDRNLIVIAARGGYQSKLVAGIPVENEGCESA